ncbi:acetyltransferase [Acanthamoeba polyphaga moumouvirus]|uniref:Glucosamine 6-phosphate N-acetyltransferase n=2 Tax=Moumouvirus TaxID=3080801 RepID=L7RD92_9VIRU|nr:acetyltransferase [Acanthamoeba polyphaga moumouvirus]AEX62668.1 putative glucosamine6-phosphateN-acetyl transferase [Moumouvirus Monve]AGC02048.1 Glucosamine 6-phosphate N-acetyltransferase [Acanthamoeba polyphaga moumouvirus]AQN68413.1 glucosamine 6-phosphate N-acetyltransferase [Saudi moumouvirus]
MNVVIEEFTLNHDYEQYLYLLKQLTALNPDNISKQQFNDQMNLILSNPNHKIIIAKCDNIIVGSLTILIEPKIIHDLSKVAHIEDVIVDQNYRSYGIGGSLIKKAIEISKENGCYKIILDCSEKNIGFYQKYGFVKKEWQMAYYFD